MREIQGSQTFKNLNQIKKIFFKGFLIGSFLLSLLIPANSEGFLSHKIGYFYHFPQSKQEELNNNQIKLSEVLKNTAEYCERLKKMAFDFVCEEKIQEKIYHYQVKKGYKHRGADQLIPVVGFKLDKREENSYVYDYQMIKKGEKKIERRILLKENGKEKHIKKAPLKTKRLSAKYLVYGPVGFLSEYWQEYFNYQIIGQENVLGKKAVVLSAVPESPRKINYNMGRIWIDAHDFSILKIKWNPKSQKFEEKISSPLGDLERSLSWVVFYSVEKNGVKFPGKQIIKEEFVPIVKENYPVIITKKGKRLPKYKAVYDYENYKFFTVEIEIKYKK